MNIFSQVETGLSDLNLCRVAVKYLAQGHNTVTPPTVKLEFSFRAGPLPRDFVVLTNVLHRRAAKTQVNLCICTDSPEHLVLAYTNHGCT